LPYCLTLLSFFSLYTFVSLLILSFFFYCSRHPRDLHSFPTRRSSDLYRSKLTLANGRQINIINIKTFIKAIIPTPTTPHFPHASSAKTYLLVVLLGS